MPRRDPNTPKIELYEDAYLFVENAKWHLRVNLPGKKQPVRSTKVAYNPDHPYNEQDARRSADALYQDIHKRQRIGLPLRVISVAQMAEAYRKESKAGYLANKEAIESGYEPSVTIEGGRGVWNEPEWRKTRFALKEYILPYWSLPNINAKGIDTINTKDIQEWIRWKANLPGYAKRAPSTIRKHHTVLRHVFKYAQRQGHINQIPLIPDPKPQLKERRRPEITGDQFEQILSYAKNKYGKAETAREIYLYQWYQFLLFLEHTGCRPFTSVRMAPKWSDISFTEDKILVHRKEKGHDWWLAADPYFAKVYKRLEKLQERLGILDKENGYLFVHPEEQIDYKGTILFRKGDPIASLYRSWENAMKHFGWNDGKTEQKDRIAPYSIRHRYAGQKLHINKDISIYDLARQMGTSVSQLETVYAHYAAGRNYDELVKGQLDRQFRIDFYWRDTGAVATSPKPNTKEYDEAMKNPMLIRED